MRSRPAQNCRERISISARRHSVYATRFRTTPADLRIVPALPRVSSCAIKEAVMPPAARLSLPSRRPPSFSLAPAQFRVQGWDPVLIISQIVAFQALHYLALALVLPVFLSLFASPDLLAYEGGPSSLALVMDWRAFTGRTVSSIPATRTLQPGLAGLAAATGGVAAEAKVDAAELARGVVRVMEWDSARGWAVALGWVSASMIDISYLYYLIRRPTHILDFSLTLVFNHLILTTYYAHAFPTAFFFWFVLATSTIAQIVLAEQLCVKREMRDGFSVADMTPQIGERARMDSDLELGQVKTGGGEYERVPGEER
ncbi:hypothetical protein JCM1841_003031 [Sporobolomyces salmonicolor]